MTAWNIIAAVLSLAGLAWSQTDPPPPAILKGNPPGGLGAHCTAPSLTGYLNSSGVLILCPSGTSVWTAQSSGGGPGVFSSVGIPSSPEVGSLLEVKSAGSTAVVDSQGYVPFALFVAGTAENSFTVMNSGFSTDVGDGFNLYQLMADGLGVISVGCATAPHCVALYFNPTTGTLDAEGVSIDLGGTSAINLTTPSLATAANSITTTVGDSSTGQTRTIFQRFNGTGVTQTNVFSVGAFPNQDTGGATDTSELEIFLEAVADAGNSRASNGVSYGSYSRGGTLTQGYREGINTVYTGSGTTWSNHGFTLFDYVNNENIYIASTTRPHTFQLGNNITALAPAVVSIGTKFTIAGCSADTTLGGATVGSFVSHTSGTCTVTITMNGAVGLTTATNGWACTANDLTTPADLIHQTATSTTTATLSGTTVSGDVVSFLCMGY